MSETMNSREIIEIGLGSIGKIKIIKALAEDSRMATLYALHKKTNLKREDIKNNLDDLVRIGWVTQSKYANVMYGINRGNKYIGRLMEFFENTGYIGEP